MNYSPIAPILTLLGICFKCFLSEFTAKRSQHQSLRSWDSQFLFWGIGSPLLALLGGVSLSLELTLDDSDSRSSLLDCELRSSVRAIRLFLSTACFSE